MSDIHNIDYSNWTNPKAVQLAKNADTDGVKGLQGNEILIFARSAVQNDISKTDFYELMGASFSKTNRAGDTGVTQNRDPNFDKAAEFYNDNYSIRSSVTYDALFNCLPARLHEMDAEIDQALAKCEAYSDIVIMTPRRWYYRYYPNYDKLINFDIEEIRNRTEKDMNSLHELKDKVEYIIEKANGSTTHNEPTKTKYNVDEIAEKYFNMSYERFAQIYINELDFCKTVTAADFSSMSETQRMVYDKAKAYAKEMLRITIDEAINVNLDVRERELNEGYKADGDMYTIIEFEDNGITEEGLSEFKSGIAFKAFEKALIDKYTTTGIKTSKSDGRKAIKQIMVDGKTLFIHPDGRIYDIGGRRIK